MTTTTKATALILLLVGVVSGDLYMHNPRGSNNRLNEKSANRANANRLFDSQNNDRGGYNVGDKTSEPAGDNAENQYNMNYFQSGPFVFTASGTGGSQLTLEWTNQHGCGGNEDSDPQKQNCNLVIQYMCEDTFDSSLKTQLRDGVNTQQMAYTPPPNTETEEKAKSRKDENLDPKKGLQESWESYDNCYIRERNAGLFTADQKLKKNNKGYSSAIHTRQNPNGNRRGYECPEERDYFPYWHPSQWKDIAVLAENSSICSHYKSKSFNTRSYHQCVETWPSGNRKSSSRWNNEAECTQNSGKWVELSNYLEKAPAFTSEAFCLSASSSSTRYMWSVPYDADNVDKPECLVALPELECSAAPWSRSNHLGNGRGDGQPLTYTWTLPYFPSGHEHKCVLRMRYNISTDDYDPYNTDLKHNNDNGVISPVQDNIELDIGGPVKLQMALNTDQTGRVFQDRSHVFHLMPRPSGWENEKIVNLNVRGKRGNIVQVYPAVEYDFTPNHLHITASDLVHIQWTGSNTHLNGNPAGDGQAGNDGEGKAGTDRLNMVQIGDLKDNFPLPYEQTTMWKNADIVWIHHKKTDISSKDLALEMSASGYYRCFKKSSCPESEHKDYIVETKTQLQKTLDNAPASYPGAVLRFRSGTYHYMCTRNNNFTNRSNKGTIHVM
ncbi:protein DD3-3-like [Mya arenaria]|uniref:protein DD3-3-like n=1 Tax=Mya arenaria TaxID=6604 RepID=UPI0022E80A32|nr:protein DD3-3-like [Mya arenaria]XP_052782189.1 protein DD3-3-like [Mya arenaria]